MKLTRTQLNSYRRDALARQGGICPLCQSSLVYADSVVDHDHATGEIRGVVHRWCNAQLGKVENASNRAKKKLSLLEWLENAVQYLRTARTGLTYPSHLSEQEKKEKAAAKRRAAAAAKRRS